MGISDRKIRRLLETPVRLASGEDPDAVDLFTFSVRKIISVNVRSGSSK